jgi:methionyl-tRNA formyltransferase
MRFGNIDHLVLLGGGMLLASFAARAKELGWPVDVVTSPRHQHEPLDPLPTLLSAHLNSLAIHWMTSSDVNTDSDVHGMITPRTLALSLGAAWIFKPALIDRCEGRLLNVHGTRLPQDRGGGGYSWRILRNDRLGYGLIHLVDSGIDTGTIVTYDEYLFPNACRTPADYREHALQRNMGMLDRFLTDVQVGREFSRISQPEYLSMYWPRLSTDQNGFVDWSWNLGDLEQFICAFDDPYAGAQTFVNDRKVRVKECFSIRSDGAFHPFQTGIVYRISAGALFIAAGQGSLVIARVTDDAGSDLVGSIRIGDRFHTPWEHLDAARRFRAVYTPSGLKS